MADIQRLTRSVVYFLFGCLLGGVAVMAKAETVAATSSTRPVVLGWQIQNGNWYATQAAGCTAQLAYLHSVNQYMAQVNSVSGGTVTTCFISNASGSGFNITIGQINSCGLEGYPTNQPSCISYTCPAGYAGPQTINGTPNMCSGCPPGKEDVAGVCKTSCPSGFHRMNPDNGTCEKDCIGDQTQDSTGKCTCAIGNNKEWISFSGSYDSTTGCANGCQYNLGGMAIGNAVTKTYYTRGQRNGSICGSNTNLTPAPKLVDKTPLPPADTSGTSKDGATPDPKNTPKNAGDPEACAAAGGSYGTYNGAAKCLTPDANTPQITTKREESATTNPDGSKSATKGSTTTTCTGTSCTSTSESSTTTTDAAGNSKTTTTTGSGSGSGTGSGSGQKDFCADRPNSIICKNSSWSGDCAIPPVCDGDAVSCATAKAVWEHRCVNKWAETANPLSDAVDQQNLFGDQAKADAALNKDGSKDFDILAKFQEKRQNYLTFASGCSPDLSFDFKGQHYQFDTTILCQFGLVIKILLHLTAYMTLIRVFTTKLF